MWELIICIAVSWGGVCQEKQPPVYASQYFCERAIPAAKANNPKVMAIYCRPRQ